ncbi:MAG: ADP-ribosylglycohydrolase family protein [Bacteroidales bacterium]
MAGFEKNKVFYQVLLVGVLSMSQTALFAAGTKFVELPASVVADKIRGGLLGQILGNLNGLAHEFKYEATPGNVIDYIPSLPEGAVTDDDTDFEWVYICEMQKNKNPLLPYSEIKKLWLERINKRVWCSNRYARYLMDIGVEPPMTGNVVLNPWADFNISGQFLCETFGLLAPAMPQTAAKVGLNYTRVAIDGEPAQTTQLFTTIIATAFVEKNISQLIDAGLASVDPASTVSQVIADVKRWHAQYPENWQETRKKLRTSYLKENGGIRDKNGFELNTGSVIAAMLYGAGNFQETLKCAFNFGWDADCNAATAGTILGTIYGYRQMMSQGWQIVDRYRNTTREDMPMDETITSFADRLIELFEQINENNGGKKFYSNNRLVYRIPAEYPINIEKLISAESERAVLGKQLENEMTTNLLKGDRAEKARAAYYAVCLDMAKDLSEKYPAEWKQAVTDLSGYWKVMNNVFYGNNFLSLDVLRKKFLNSGFKKPEKEYSANEMYTVENVWKEPK